MADDVERIACYATDNIERETLAPIAAELERRRGATVTFTDDLTTPADVGLYACHGSILFDFDTATWRPLSSDVSIVVTHDFDQDGDQGIQFFALEGWGRFDLGLVPGRRLFESAENAGRAGLALPRHGVHSIGWPKSDRALSDLNRLSADAAALAVRLGIGRRPVILLACSWSTARQLSDLLAAVEGIDADIVVRYPNPNPPVTETPWSEALVVACRELEDAVTAATADPRVIVTDTSTDLYASLALADLVVSNGSNVAYEAILTGTPVISVSSWRHRAGVHGFDFVEPHMELGGVADREVSDLGATIHAFLTGDMGRYVAEGRESLVPPETLGASATVAADRIEAAVDSVLEVPRLRRRVTDLERELAEAKARAAELEGSSEEGASGA